MTLRAAGRTVTSNCADAPRPSFACAVMIAVEVFSTACALTVPYRLTAATLGSEDDQTRPRSLAFLGSTLAVRRAL